MNFDAQETKYKALTESNIEYYNRNKRQKITINFYVADGNRADVQHRGVFVVRALSMQKLHFFIFGYIQGLNAHGKFSSITRQD